VKYLKRARWAAIPILMGTPMVWTLHYDPLTPRSWLGATLYATYYMAMGGLATGVLVLTIAWAAGTFDKKVRRP
jgi:hypothetical protein